MKQIEDVYVTMSDGIRIAVRIYRPDSEDRFPTLFAASPYQYDTDDLPHSPLFLWREIGPVEWYVQQGYVYVHADVRGSGKSEGDYRFLDKREQTDLYELIEWIAQQSWSNGKVGGIGQSYYAWSQWHMAIMNPPHLSCIAPYDGAVDPYRGTAYLGGIYGDFMPWWYNLVRVNNLHRAVNDSSGKAFDYDLGGEIIAHQTYDDWWRERTAFERLSRIKVPVLTIGHWGKIGLHLRGNILGYEHLKGQKKLVVTGARDVFETHDQFDKIEFHKNELLPFYDYCLKGIDNKYFDGPPVKIFVRGDESYRMEKAWPLQRAEYTSYYLRKGPSGSVTSLNDGGLSTEKPSQDEGATSYSYPDPLWKLGVVAVGKNGPDPVSRVLTFTSPPLEKELEVTGPIVFELFASSDQKDTDFFVKLSDQEPLSQDKREKGMQPPFTNVSKGWLRASHREKDEARSTTYRPYYTHGNPQPVQPGEICQFEIEVHPTSYVFKENHRIRIELVNGDSSVTDGIFTHQYIPYKVGTDTIHHNVEYPSRILLPVIPRT